MSTQRVLSSGCAPQFRACLLSSRPHLPDRISCPLADIVVVIIGAGVYWKLGCREKRPVSSCKAHYRRREDSVRS